MPVSIVPIFRERSDFYKKYAKYSIPDMLRLHGFSVFENEIDDEDIVYIEKTKAFLMSKGIVDVPIYFKNEFFAEFPLKYTNVVIEGFYRRKPTGEKMYRSYSYNFYRESFRSYKGEIGKRNYAEGVNKITLLRIFEEYKELFEFGKEIK
ncbi:hypothetical protein [Enterococcus gallinarum]|uniref:hypothetical protein n=1 Tax=Enterococcus gallinarum TaxID=1353 RepID=UPI001E498712|nr:hypothetical protein [Enterococcus gallinarum]